MHLWLHGLDKRPPPALCSSPVLLPCSPGVERTTLVQAFLEIGRERNRIVHQDYGAISLEKTAEEIYALYQKAEQFVEQLPRLLSE